MTRRVTLAIGRPHWRSGARLVLLIGAGLVVALAAVAALVQALPVSFGLLLGMSAFAPYCELAGIAALAVFVPARAWVGVLICLLCLVILVITQAGLYVADTAPPGPRLNVMTANLKIGSARAGALVQTVRANRVDVLMTQELTGPELADLHAAGLDRVLPYSVTDERPEYAGTGIWSRTPLSNGVRHTDFDNALVTATLDATHTRPAVHLVALHLPGPVPVATDWTRDLDRLDTLLKRIGHDAPVVVGGDFNATPDTHRFERLLSGGYADAADQAGAGFVPTYPAQGRFPPMITIDHVLTRGAVAGAVDTYSLPGSDHRALLAVVVLPAT